MKHSCSPKFSGYLFHFPESPIYTQPQAHQAVPGLTLTAPAVQRSCSRRTPGSSPAGGRARWPTRLSGPRAAVTVSRAAGNTEEPQPPHRIHRCPLNFAHTAKPEADRALWPGFRRGSSRGGAEQRPPSLRLQPGAGSPQLRRGRPPAALPAARLYRAARHTAGGAAGRRDASGRKRRRPAALRGRRKRECARLRARRARRQHRGAG